MLCATRLAIALRIVESSRSSNPVDGVGEATAATRSAIGGADEIDGVRSPAAAADGVRAATSRRMILPPGPDPLTIDRSIPCVRANLFARGEALTRSGATA